MHKLLYETKAMGKEQYHNNFDCYGFIARPNASHPVPTFQKRWPGNWMEEWFYVKNSLTVREDIKEVIMRPIWSHFGLRKPKVEIDDAAKACQKAFGTVCFFIGTRDLVQEHIAFRVWPLVESWEMPKETITKSSEGELVRMKYTFRYGDKFDEPNNDWLKCIEVTSDELLGAYSKAEDNALSTAFGGRGKKRINRVFDTIGFVYPDYHYPLWGQGKKRKAAASAIPAESVPKAMGKKMKVLTHRPRYIEPAVVPEFGGEATSAAELREPVPPMQRTEEPAIMSKAPSVELVETKVDKDKAERSKTEEVSKMAGILSPSTEATALKAEKSSATTPKRRRMVNVLDILETTDSISPAPTRKVAEADKMQPKADTKQIEVEATKTQAETEARPTVPTNTKLAPTEQGAEGITPDTNIAFEKSVAKEAESLTPEAPSEGFDYIIRHASGKRLSEEEISEAKHYARESQGALVFNGTTEDDFLYCLPDSKELSVCREIGRSMGFPKLEAGLCAMTKADLADSLAYNSLKV
jgi:hypothetical protein